MKKLNDSHKSEKSNYSILTKSTEGLRENMIHSTDSNSTLKISIGYSPSRT
jgi:hypothetical protein